MPTLPPVSAALPVAMEARFRLAFRRVVLCGRQRTPTADMPRCLSLFAVFFAAVVPVFFLPGMVQAAQAPNIPGLQLSLSGGSMEPRDIALGLEILFLLTVLSLAPAIVLTITSFTRIIVVFHFVRQALGVQQLPPNQVLVSLAIFMSAAIMFPVGKAVNDTALQPYLEERMDFAEALSNAEKPIREFMYKHTREKDLSIFYSITRMERPATRDDVPLMSLAAAFMISELKTGFIIGFLIYIPFLILDMVISSILLAMGMMMLPPMMVSMPFKLLLFVMVDGWTLLVGSLVNSFTQ
jgi:flagellar biosynthetic protein FliP